VSFFRKIKSCLFRWVHDDVATYERVSSEGNVL